MTELIDFLLWLFNAWLLMTLIVLAGSLWYALVDFWYSRFDLTMIRPLLGAVLFIVLIWPYVLVMLPFNRN